MPTSQNGWSANDVSKTSSFKVPGTVRALRLRTGDAGFLLVHLAAWFDKAIESIDYDGELDDWGYAERPIRGSATTLSNHASGTAIDLNATRHPLGAVGTFLSGQSGKIRNHLRVYDGVIRWGGEYHTRKDEMHFEIVGNAAQVAAVARRLRATPTGGTAPAPTGGTAPAPSKPGFIYDLSNLNYAARGGFFHVGQAPALAEARMFIAWARRLGVATERDVRIWEGFLRENNWSSAGLQFAGIVRKLQARHNLVPDGVVGPKTAALLTHDGYLVKP